MKKVFIFINGILNFPSSADGWTDRAVTWTHLNTDARGEKYEYACGVLTRRIYQQRRAEKLAKMIGFYAGDKNQTWSINLVAHSNGCDVILRTLDVLLDRSQKVEWVPKIDSLHLISGATEADFAENGLNEWLEGKKLDRVCVYVGAQDLPMKIAHSTRWLRKLGLGYGTLGMTGPLRVAPTVESRVTTVVVKDFGHSNWFDRHEFNSTLSVVTK